MQFTFLTSHDKSFEAIWAWARRLVQDLNTFTARTGISTGTIAMWPVTAVVPDGWLECNGQTIIYENYKGLAIVFGATGDFALPAYVSPFPSTVVIVKA